MSRIPHQPHDPWLWASTLSIFRDSKSSTRTRFWFDSLFKILYFRPCKLKLLKSGFSLIWNRKRICFWHLIIYFLEKTILIISEPSEATWITHWVIPRRGPSYLDVRSREKISDWTPRHINSKTGRRQWGPSRTNLSMLSSKRNSKKSQWNQ